ncbi:hypothetical protein J6590_074517 [Homalodisca vitripennis]|nr:hypothetical protein J6590_074517 [Homalodisca vitripennis]
MEPHKEGISHITCSVKGFGDAICNVSSVKPVDLGILEMSCMKTDNARKSRQKRKSVNLLT